MRIEFGKRELDVSVAPSATVAALQHAIAAKAGLSPARQALKVKQAPGDDPKKAVRLTNSAKTVASYGVGATTVLELKDMGPQIGYRTVFVVEYLGPILIMALYASRPALLSGAGAATVPWNPVALLGVALWVAHFLKRELETFFVHRFSRPTMPLANLFKNSVYYWGFAAAVGYPLCHPLYTAPASQNQVCVGGVRTGIYAVAVGGYTPRVDVCHPFFGYMPPAEAHGHKDGRSSYLSHSSLLHTTPSPPRCCWAPPSWWWRSSSTCWSICSCAT